MNNYEVELSISDLLESKRYEEAYDLLIPLASKESEYALLTLGWMHENGAFVERDLDLARSYYERVIALGSLEAYLRLGRSFSDWGQKAESRPIFAKGAELGDLGCMNEFGAMLYEGEGGPADAAAGIAWLERAASQGHFFAQRKLLSIRSRSSKSITTRILVFFKIIILGVKGAIESLRDSSSERLK